MLDGDGLALLLLLLMARIGSAGPWMLSLLEILLLIMR